MTVEDKKVIGGGGGVDNIGVGMRVLAVDDNPTCLKILESMLRKCQYEVTVTSQAITALKLLRENKNKYDLVISDVNMPDMDGFKLLELVGIEMDLPVIMLSEYGDKEFVYKGVSHGAVDYLVKPVRLRELKNIWQHVIRRKKLYPKDQNWSQDQDKSNDVGESGRGVASSGSIDWNLKLNRKRKDQDEEDDEASEENGIDNDEPCTQKKPRVVWSVELHQKFVDAVNQLGFAKAVPKKILDLMGVDGLTRENVASHLQKYRLYLKRLSTGAQPGNLVAAYGARDSAFLRLDSMDGIGDFRTLRGPGRLSSTSLSSYVPGSMIGRLNSPGGLTLRGIANSGLLQCHSQTSSNSANNGKLQPALLTGNPVTSILQGIPSSLDPNQPHSKSATLIGEFSRNNDKTGFAIAGSFPDARVTIGSLANSMSNASGNSLMHQVNPQQNQSRGAFGTQSSLRVPSMNRQCFDFGISGSSDFLDHGRCTESWQNTVQLSKFPSNSLPIGEPYNLRDNISSASSHIGNGPIDFCASSALTESFEDSKPDMQSQAGLIGNIVQSINYPSRQRWGENGQENNPSFGNVYGNMNPMVSGNAVGPVGQGMEQRRKHEAPSIGQINVTTPTIFQHAEIGRSAADQKKRSNEDHLLEETKSQGGFIQNNYESLDDLMNAMIKQDLSEAMLMDGEFTFDAYSL